MNRLVNVAVAALAGALLLLGGGSARAETYPDKPIRLIVPYAPGGFATTLAHLVGEKLGEGLGQRVVVDNRPGANGNIASGIAVKSPADGYTLLLGTISTMTINPSLYASVPFDPVKDFEPVSLLVFTTNVVVVKPDFPAKSIKELIAYAKANPGKLTFGSSGNDSTLHLSGELFKMMTGTKLVHVPYKGGAPALTDLMGGRISLMFSDTMALNHVAAGKLRALATTSAKRLPVAPDLPTVAEAGVPGYAVDSWYGIVVPAGTPKSIVAKLNAEISKVMRMKDIHDKLVALGAEPAPDTTQARMAATIKADLEKWAKVVKESGARAE